METLYDDLFDFVAKPGDPVSFCHLKVVQGDGEALILVTQRVDLTGQVALGYSIGYAAAYLATTIVNRFDLDPAKTVYLQHYERTDGAENTFSRVEFDWNESEYSGGRRYTATNPRWTEIAEVDLASLFKGEDLTKG